MAVFDNSNMQPLPNGDTDGVRHSREDRAHLPLVGQLSVTTIRKQRGFAVTVRTADMDTTLYVSPSGGPQAPVRDDRAHAGVLFTHALSAFIESTGWRRLTSTKVAMRAHCIALPRCTSLRQRAKRATKWYA